MLELRRLFCGDSAGDLPEGLDGHRAGSVRLGLGVNADISLLWDQQDLKWLDPFHGAGDGNDDDRLATQPQLRSHWRGRRSR